MEHERGPHYRLTQTRLNQRQTNRFELPPRITGRRMMAVPISARPKTDRAVATQSVAPRPTVIAVNMNLPGATETPGSRYYIKREQAKAHRAHLRVVRRSSLAVMALLLLLGGGLSAQAYLKLHQAFKGGGETVAALQAAPEQVDPNALKGEGSGRINVLLLGKGGANHPGGELTDTMLVASLDPVNNRLALLSIPRDMWVTDRSGASMKINAVYVTAKNKALKANRTDLAAAEAAGMAATEQMVGNVIGVPIHYYAMFDFTAFKDAVDAVGGVNIDVPADLYDPTMAWENNNNPVLASKGPQQMDGKQALLYVRSRETSSDFARTERQRQLMTAIENKALTAGTLTNPIKMSSLINAFGNHFSSDLSLANAERLANMLKNVDLTQIQSIGLTDAGHNFVRTDRVGDQSVVRPLAGFNSYGDIQAYVRNSLRDGYLAKEDAGILVLNGSATNARAGDDMATELKSYGYKVIGSRQLNTIYKQTQLIDLTSNTDKYTRHYLEERLQLTAQTSLPAGVIDTSGAQFVIIVGNE